MKDRRPLKILSVYGTAFPIPPKFYGGAERYQYYLISELAKRGHHQILFARADSQVPCRLVPYSFHRKSMVGRSLSRLLFWSKLWRYGRSADIIDWQAGGFTYMFPPVWPTKAPIVVTSHNPYVEVYTEWLTKRLGKRLTFVALSNAQRARGGEHGDWRLIYHGLDRNLYKPGFEQPLDGHLLFLGTLTKEKGVHLAIEVALKAQSKLKIAGPRRPSADGTDIFEAAIQPHLGKGLIDYVGEVNDSQKNALFTSAKALLFPIMREEGLTVTLLESLACGTPIIALNRTCVPEVVNHGVTGFVCDSVEEMIDAVSKLPSISREHCRQGFEERFTSERCATEYENLFYELIQRQ